MYERRKMTFLRENSLNAFDYENQENRKIAYDKTPQDKKKTKTIRQKKQDKTPQDKKPQGKTIEYKPTKKNETEFFYGTEYGI